MLSLSFMEVPLLRGSLWGPRTLVPSGAWPPVSSWTGLFLVTPHLQAHTQGSPSGAPPFSLASMEKVWHPEFPDSSAQLCGLLGNILSLAPCTLATRRVGTGKCLRVATVQGQARFFCGFRFSRFSASPVLLPWCGDSDLIPSEYAELLPSPPRMQQMLWWKSQEDGDAQL